MSVESPGTPPQPENKALSTRRAFLGGAMGTIGVLLVGSDRKQTEVLPFRNLDHITPLANRENALENAAFEQLNPEYISSLLSSLERETGDAWTRLEATKGALRRVDGFGPGRGAGTALQIDESGIYLTAKHVVSDPQRPNEPIPYFTSITNPFTGESVVGMEYILHPRADIALISAPTGKPRKPIPGIQMNFGEVQQNERLLMVSLFPMQQRGTGLIFEEGSADRSFTFTDLKNNDGTYSAESAASLAVRGLIPRGGSSGGPIINNSGVVIGVESGAYPTARDRKDYRGARITPLTYLQSLPLGR